MQLNVKRMHQKQQEESILFYHVLEGHGISAAFGRFEKKNTVK